MHRREFLATGAAAALGAAFPRSAFAIAPFAPKPDVWRKYEITTRAEIAKPSGKVQAWLPLPAVNEPDWMRPLGNEWTTNASTANVKRDPKYGAEMLHVQWDGEPAPVAEVVSRFATRDRAVDLAKPGAVRQLSAAE